MSKLKMVSSFFMIVSLSIFFHLNIFAAKLTHENAKEGNKSEQLQLL